jgi:hypothetical protein
VRLCPQRADRALHELRDLDRGRLNLRMSLQILDVVLAIFLAFATSSSPVGSGCGRSAPREPSHQWTRPTCSRRSFFFDRPFLNLASGNPARP